MINRDFDLEFLTPCFCAGAIQTRAELRPSAIRGQLRWWFRALGGSLDEEWKVFGAVYEKQALASSFIVRARCLAASGQDNWFDKIPRQGMGNKTYLLGFFCGRTERIQKGAALPPGSKARVSFLFYQPPSEKLEQAMRMFFSVGALGFRSTRAAGAFQTDRFPLSRESWRSLTTELERAGFNVGLLDDQFRDWVQLCERAGDFLKNTLRSRQGLGIRAGRDGTAPNALGSATPRQASVVHLRPVFIDNHLRLAVLEAPHARILGRPAADSHNDRGSIVKLARLQSYA